MYWIDSDSINSYSIVNSLYGTEMFLTFAVTGDSMYTQNIKVAVGPNDINEFAVWNEFLPFDTNLLNSDSNPPALEISYLRTPLIERSILG